MELDLSSPDGGPMDLMRIAQALPSNSDALGKKLSK